MIRRVDWPAEGPREARRDFARCNRGIVCVAASTQLCLAADPRYPDWPCAQAKVPEISLAAVWAGPPLGDAEEKWKNDPESQCAGRKSGGQEDSAR